MTVDAEVIGNVIPSIILSLPVVILVIAVFFKDPDEPDDPA
jgi:hypothetical protein